ncbi:MAG: hypothetical protein C0613_00675 [Desulfobulbaceae bacterium]|nr:MAG: hypothetical protein C0613_00675 [Desulfobulbaceae bacterium]
MISKVKVHALIDDIERDYIKCWDILCGIKEYSTKSGDINKIFEFQPILANAIFKLSRKYRAIHQEKQKVIGKKKQLTPSWFKRRLKLLSGYQKSIKETILIGKSLGDSYAWFWYQKDRSFIQEHLKHEEIFHFPPGIGGIGELEFIKNTKGFEGHLIIYHGTTSFLRLGDISFIDLKSMKVSGIGEIKTKKISENKIQVNLFIQGTNIENKLTFLQKKELSEPPKRPQEKLPEWIKTRLKKQLKEVHLSFENQNERKVSNKISREHKFHYDSLTELYRKIKENKFCYVKVGDGLLLVGYALNRKSLSGKLDNRSIANLNKKLSNLIPSTMEIISKKREDNSIFIDSLHYTDGSKIYIMLGMVPLFWWPISPNLIKQIIFQDLVLVTIFNPSFLMEKLESVGFETENNGRKYRVYEMIDNNRLEFEGVSYFMRMIQQYLFTEESILDLLISAKKEILSKKIEPRTKLVLQIEQKIPGLFN